MSETLYRQLILDHYRNPRHFGILKKPTHEAGHVNVSCGDQVRFQASIKNGKIIQAGFTGEGCAISIAAASMVSEFAQGKSVATVQKLQKKNIEKLLGISISGAREKCAMLGLETLQALKKINRKSQSSR